MRAKLMLGFLVYLGLGVFLVGCALPLPSAGWGVLITNATEGVSVNNNVPINRSGEACTTNALGLASFGDASISKAMGNAGITRVATVDRRYFGILCLFARACTVVSGD